jgi:hypothetical protein
VWLLVVIAALVLILSLSHIRFAHVADAVTIVSAPLAVAALFLGAWQLARTGRATVAATRAATQAAQDFATFRILFLINDAHRIADLLGRAENAQGMGQELVNWNRVGGELRGLLDKRLDAADDEFLRALSGSFVLATTAKEKLEMGSAKPQSAVKEARKAISDLTAPLGILSGKLEVTIGKREP